MPALLCCPGMSGSRQGKGQRFMINEDGEADTDFQYDTEVPEACKASPQLPVKRPPLQLGYRQLLGKEPQGRPIITA